MQPISIFLVGLAGLFATDKCSGCSAKVTRVFCLILCMVGLLGLIKNMP